MRLLMASIALDVAIGDPSGRMHPVRIMGAIIESAESFLRKRFAPTERGELLGGAALAAGMCGATYLFAVMLLSATRRASPALHAASWILIGWSTIAIRTLLAEGEAVVTALEQNDLIRARERVARIVGRDTDALSASEIARATIEALAESTCDGVVAPLLYLALCGPPAALAYRALNTLDSMIGHREQPYTYFGRAAARMDDGANLIPARLSALAIVAAAAIVRGEGSSAWQVWRRDGARHASPNAGQSEAAMAGALRVRLGGTNHYAGQAVDAPILGAAFSAPRVQDAREALRVTRMACALACLLACALRVLRSSR